MSFNLKSLGFGIVLSLMDVVSFSFVKNVSLGMNPMWMILPSIVYAFSPYVLLQSLTSESLVIMNLLWDLCSDVLITCVGLYFFKETLSPTKMLGVVFSFISIFLMTYNGDLL